MRKLSLIACALTVLTLTGCAALRTPDGATDASETAETLCQVWGESLPTRSRNDTEQTALEIGEAYADFVAACPGHSHLVP